MIETIGKILNNVDGQNFEPDDYLGSDGLVYCGKCNTPKQCRPPMPETLSQQLRNILGKNPKRCLCECEIRRSEERRMEDEARRKMDSIRRLKADGVQDKNMLEWTFENDDGTNPELMNKARKYASAWQKAYEENIGLLLYGDVGAGKTYFAACIGNALLDQNVPVLMTNFPRLLNKLTGLSEDRNEFINSLNQFKLLIIDDLGVERQSDFALEQVYNVIDARYKNGQPVIITTNLTFSEIQNPPDMRYKRIYDRIVEMALPIKVIGESRRPKKQAEKMKLAKELLK